MGRTLGFAAMLTLTACVGPAATPTPSPTPVPTERSTPTLAPSSLATLVPTDPGDPSPSPIPSLPTELALEGREWLLVRVDAVDPPLDVPPAWRATLTLIDGIASGDSGCNTFQGSYAAGGTDVVFGILTTTAMPCGGSAAATEAGYLAALRAVARSGAWEEGMALYSADGAPLLGFVAAVAGRLEGSWAVDVYRDLRGALMPAVKAGAPTLVFGADGAISGSDGCNDYAGTYRVDGPRIGIAGLTGTRTACASDELATQEEGFLAALLGSTRWSATRTELTLRGDDGQLRLSLVRAPG